MVGKMATLTKYRGRWSVKIRRKGHRGIYETFDKLSDARSFINKVESDIQLKTTDASCSKFLKPCRLLRVIQPLVSGCLVNSAYLFKSWSTKMA